MNATERLDEIEARAAAATERPWIRVITADRKWNEVRSPSDDIAQEGDERPVARCSNDDSAEFIAHARQDVPALVSALRAVLDIHRHVHADPREYDCTACRQADPGRCEHDGRSWPCPTVRAITNALGGTP